MRFLSLLFTALFLVPDVLGYMFRPFTLTVEGSLQLKACHTSIYSSATFCSGQSANSYKCYCSNKYAMASLAGCITELKHETNHFYNYFHGYCATQNVTITKANFTDSLELLSASGRQFTAVVTTSSSSSKGSSASATGSSVGASSKTSGASSVTGTVSASSNLSSSGRSGSASTRAAVSESSSSHQNSGSSSASSSPTSLAKRAAAVAASSAPMVAYPIYANKTKAKVYYDAYELSSLNSNRSYWFSTTLYAYWAFVCFVAAACNWGVVIFPGLRTTFNGRLSKAWRKYVTLPALIRRKRTNHQKVFGVLDFLVPTRMEGIILSGFFWLTFLFNALNMNWQPGNPNYATKGAAVLKLVSDRTGIIGTMLLPLLILIGGRNNFLQWLTRWKFSTFVLYHRWIGRAIVAMVFVHSFAYGAMKYKTLATFMKKEYIIYGTAGTGAGVIICFQGLLVLRRNFYEIFLVIHILMAVAFMWGTWVHLKNRMYMEWVIASCAVWSFDRFVRLARMLSFGLPKATVTLLADDCLRVVVPKPSYWPSVPGGHAWVYFAHSWYFWQSHPFTFLDSTVEKDKIVFIVKSKKGATNYLAKSLAERPGKTATIRVCVEGPYGESCSVRNHDNVVFVAGGNGIPGIYSECYDLARKSVNNAKQRIKLIWVLREISTIEWVWQELHALKNTKVETTVYITRSEGCNESILLERMLQSDESSSSDEKDSLSKEKRDMVQILNDYFPHVTFQYGRPSMDAVVDEETEEAAKSAAFITCGHPIMVDDLRYAVVQKIDKTEKRVDFFEQLRVWA